MSEMSTREAILAYLGDQHRRDTEAEAVLAVSRWYEMGCPSREEMMEMARTGKEIPVDAGA